MIDVRHGGMPGQGGGSGAGGGGFMGTSPPSSTGVRQGWMDPSMKMLGGMLKGQK
jgi:hypothetical protein